VPIAVSAADRDDVCVPDAPVQIPRRNPMSTVAPSATDSEGRSRKSRSVYYRRGAAVALCGALLVVASACQVGKAGARCRPNGDWGRDSTYILHCVSGRWQRTMTIQQYANILLAPKPSTPAPAPTESVSQHNARQEAANYLQTEAFSRSGLIDQLKFEGFSDADATYGTDAQGADWNAQAARMAKEYLNTMPFSHQELVDQLVFDGFTQAQAEYGVSTTGL
jgi:hypothetical protein